MANNTEDIKWLYDKLKGKGYDIGNEQEFTSSLASQEDRDWYYDKAVGMGLNVGSKDDFNALYAPVSAPAPQPKQDKPVQPQSAPQPKPTQTATATPQQTTTPKTEQQPASTPAPAPQPTWQPTEQEKIRMSYNLNSMMSDFNARSRARIEQARRVAERNTPEGRRKLKAAKFQAQLASTPTQVMGLTPDMSASPSGNGQGDTGEQAKPLLSGQGPVPYGVVEVNGQRKTQWLLPDGSLTTDFMEADKAEYGARRFRLMNQFVGRMKENGLDPSKHEDVQRQAQLDYEAPIRKAVAAAVQADDERSDKEQEAYMSNPLNMVGGVNAALGHAAARKQAGIGDLNLIAENAYNSLPPAYRRDLIASYTDHFTKHPEDTNGKTIDQAAKDAAKSVVYGQVHEEYVKRNGPQSKNEFFIRKMLELNPASVALSGTINPYGQAYAELDAMERYGAEHRGLDIAGMVAGMAMDPTTYLGGWAGNIAFKNATRAAGKVMAKKAMGDVAGRYASTTLAGRIIGGMAAGGANFGTFEAVKDAERQLYQGGYLNPETGEMEGFSFGSVLNSGVHGIGMGAATGVVSPLIGNVADGWVKATTSTAGKAALRTGETAVSKLFEGTIFAAPDVYAIQTMPDEQFDKLYSKQYGYDTLEDEQKKTDARKEARKDLSGDAWSESMAMMMGFGLSHAIKTAPAMIRSLRPVMPTGDRPLTRDERIHNNKSFAERLRERLDQSPSDIAISDEEREELKRKGYGNLSDLFAYDPEHKSRKVSTAQEAEGDYKGTTGLSRTINYEPRPDEPGNPEFDGYESMERLMEDESVSEATRAKAYYIITGRNLPMSTFTGWSREDTDDGSIIITSLSHQGGIVTSRRFSGEKEAQAEIERIQRQSELNTIDIGEQYRNAEAQERVMSDAIQEISPGADPQTVYNIYEAAKRGDKDVTEEQHHLADMIDEAIERNMSAGDDVRPEGIRDRISQETGVDIDKAIRKEPGKRTEAEQEAVKRYARELFPEQRTYEPTQEESEADRIYEDSRLLYGRFEQGDPEAQAEIDAISLRMTEAHQLCEDAFGDEAEVYIAEIKENPWGTLNNPELTPDQKDAVLYYINAKAALDGVLDASNEAAADKRQRVQEEVAQRTHKERGVIIPATMKAEDKQVYVINGEVAMFPDGSGVDVSNSSNDVIILDESGEYKFASPDQILNVGETIDPQTELQTAYETIDREQETIIGGATDGVPETSNSVPNSEEIEENDGEKPAETPESVPNVQEYDRGYEEGTQIAITLDDNILNAAIDDLRGRDFLSDEWRGRLEAYEYEQQRRAMEGSQASPENIPEEGNNAGENIPDNAPEEEKAPSALERIPVDEQTGDPILTHESVDADTAWEAATEFFGTPEDALTYVQAEIGNAKTAITTAEKAVGKVNPTGGMTKYRNDLKAARDRVEAAKTTLAKWQAIEEAQKRRKAEEAAAKAAETAARNAQLHDEAVARFEEEQRIKAEKHAEQERIGTHAVNPKIKEKWDASPKVDGHPDVITLPDGSTLTGHYVMTEAGAASASHDVNNAFEPTEGFPIDKHGQSVNDRDYKRDRDAQQIVHNMADAYDSRAMQTPVIVSKDGIVLSGNNRTMSGDMAATQGTDGAYLEYLSKYGRKYGLTPEQVQGMKHPCVVFVPDEDLPYDANTFSRFNAQEMKSQSKPEAAIKLGKIVDDATFNRIVADLNKYDRLSDFYADQEAAARTLGELVAAGAVNDKQLPELRTGTALSAAGKELIENTLIGKIFQAEPDAVRMIIPMPTLRQAVILGLNEIANNRTLAEKGYDLSKELSDAVDLVFRAKTASPDIYKDGMPVSPFGRMQGLFDDEYGESRVTDATTLILADLFNSTKPSDVRKVLAMYNKSAGEAAAGMVDIFSETGNPDTKEEILTKVNEHFRNATPKEQQALVDAAIEQRKREAEQAAAEQAGRGETGNEAQSSNERGGESQPTAVNPDEPIEPEKTLTPEEEALTARIEITENEWEEGDEKTPTYKREIFIDGKHKVVQVDAPDKKGEYTGSVFEYDGKTFSYVGEVTDYIDKQQTSGEKSQPDEPSEEKPIEGLANYTHQEVKDIVRREVEQIFSDADIDAEIVGMEIHGSRSRGDARPDSDLDIVLEYKGDAKEYAMFNAINETPIEIDGIQVDVNPIRKEETGTLPDYMKKSRSYDEEKIREAAASAPSLGERIAEAEATVNIEPTEAQKEAGNYRKGHVQVGTFDVTIENPKGSKRSGTDADGTPWETTMTHAYGYIKGTKGVDGDHIDVYLSSDIDDWDGRKVFVVDQYNPDGSFDEHKVMLGFNDRDEAYSAYLSNYEKGWEDGRRLDCTEVNLEDFEKWIESSKRKTKAFTEYKRVRTTCPVCGKAHIPDYKSNDVTCPQCGTDLSVFRQIDQLTDDEAAELSDKFKGEDKQGNPIDHMGRLIVEDVMTIDEVCDGDFTNPTRTVGLPELPGKVSDAIGAEGRKPIIKKNIFVKNRDSHKDLTPEDGRKILKEVLYNPDLYGQNQKVKRPYNWILVHLAEKNSSVILEVNPTKDHLEIVNWHYLNGRQLEQKKRQAEREGGRILTLQESNAAGDASQGLSSWGKDNALLSDKQGKGAESSDGYTITPTTYTNKKGKTSDVWLVKFGRDLSKEEKAALDTYIREPLAEGRKTPRGWYDRKEGGYMMRSEEAAKGLAGMLGNDEAVADAQPLSAKDYKDATGKPERTSEVPKPIPMNRVDVEGLFNDLRTKGETRLPDHAEPVSPKSEPEPKRMVVDDEMRDMENELRSLLGIDDSEGDRGDLFRNPEDFTNKERMQITSLGITYALKYFDQGIVSFPDFADKMVRRMGEKIRPWLKAFYGGARDIPGYDHLPFTPADEVKAFDVMNFDKAEKDTDPMRTAQGIVSESRAEVAVTDAQREITEQRNQKRKERDEQTTADTEAITKQAEATASEAEATAESAVDEQSIAAASEKIDEALEKVNDQLALLGYYESERVEKDYNEAYGYMRNAEKKALADAVKLAKQLVKDLGIEIDKVTGSTTAKKSKKPTAVSANIAPAGGDISIRLPLNEGRELSVNIYLDPTASPGEPTYSGDNFQVSGIMYRVENPNGTGHERYGSNSWASVDGTYSELLHMIQRETYRYLPERSTKKGEYRSGDSIQYSSNGGKSWTDGKVVEVNHDGSLKLDTGLAPVLYVNATQEQVRRKEGLAKAEPSKKEPEKPQFPDPKDKEAVSDWLSDNSAAIWDGVDAITKDAKTDTGLRNTFKAANDDSIKEADLSDYVERWLAERIEDMMELHPATVKAWYDYGQQGIILSTIAGRIDEALAKEAKSDKKNETVNGYKRGDEVLWNRYGNGQWEKQTITDFDEAGRPILDSFGQNWITEVADWERIKPVEGKEPEQESTTEATDKAVETLTGKKKEVRKTEVKPKQVVFRFAETEGDFDMMLERAVSENGYATSGLADKELKTVQLEKHDFAGQRPISQAKEWARRHIVGTHMLADEEGNEIAYEISKRTIDKYLSSSAIDKSDNLGVHLAVLKALPEVIGESVEAEVHPDYLKGYDGKRRPENGYNPDALVHRFYGAVALSGQMYRVKTTIKEFRSNKLPAIPHSYEVTKIELLPEDDNSKMEPTVSPQTVGAPHGIANLLKNVEKSYGPGKKLIEAPQPDPKTMEGAVVLISDKLNTPIRVISRKEAEAEGYRRKKGWYDRETGQIAIVADNHRNVGDIVDTAVHEVVVHHGVRQLFGTKEKLNNALDQLYDISSDKIRADIDGRAERMMDDEVERLRETMRKEHEERGENPDAEYYADMAKARIEAEKQREQIRRDATEEYAADLGMKIGVEGFERMDAEELTFWGKLKGMLQKALDRLLSGLKLPKMRAWTDKEWSYVLWKSWRNLREGNRRSFFTEAEDIVRREKSNFGASESRLFRDGDLGLEEAITKMKADAAAANGADFKAKQDAMRAIGGNLSKLRQAMARQREYDITTVKSMTDLGKILLDAGLLDDLSKYETKRILSAIKDAVGREDTSKQVQRLMDIMVDNQLRMGANYFGKLLSVKGSRIDARGIEVQGELDPDGQKIAQVVKKATTRTLDDIDNMMAEAINRMSSTDQAVADEAALEYAGLQIARQYVEEIRESKNEEKELRKSIDDYKAERNAEAEDSKKSIEQARVHKDAGHMTEQDFNLLVHDIEDEERARWAAFKQYAEATNDAIRQNKIERAEAYRSLTEQLGGVLGESVERAKQWREAEKQRVEEIHHNANSDMEGRPTNEHHKENRLQKFVNNDILRFLLAPLGTFDQMLRMFGSKSVRGEGYLWNRYMRGWVDCTEKEYTGYQEALKTLDKKVSEIFGKDMKWGDLFDMERRMPKASVRFWDGGEMRDHELTQGNLLYIYMTDKMTDGRMKLRRMGITENEVESIKDFVDPRFIQLADWMQEEYLTEKRNGYNEVHKRMFGTSMAAIENYFPLKILANARMEDVDVADDTGDNILPATSTGSIIKRKRNNLALDVTGADAFSVILDHIQQMERWAAFAEYNRDLNTLLSYKRFRNQVMNMTSAYGAGKTLWTNFRNVAAMAAGAYRPPIAPLDKAAVNIAKGVTAAKVSFRVFTALKQFLSMPAYVSDSNPMYLAANIVNPFKAWTWSMENLPIFEKRWKSRMAGDPRLLKSDMDWKMWRSRIVEVAGRVGMSPNAFVDALTVAIGARSMYQTKLAKYKRQGYTPEQARKRARQDATILFNQTQQSSEGAFLSTMQVDRSWLSVLFTVFRNSSMSYTRQLYDAMRNIGHRLRPGYKGMTEEFMAKQMRRDGIDPAQADRNAKQEYRRGIIRDLVRIGIFGYALQLAWNLGAYLPYLIFGKNADEKDKMWDNVLSHSMFGSVEGLTGGDAISAALNQMHKGEMSLRGVAKDMPAVSDLEAIYDKFGRDNTEAMNDVINLCVQSGFGFNPQTLTDVVVAIIDWSDGDMWTAREITLLVARILNCPQSQLDEIYFDEIGMSGEEIAEIPRDKIPEVIAERYAEYKLHRNAPLTGWAYDDEGRKKAMEKSRKKAKKAMKERMTSSLATERTRELLDSFDEVSEKEKELNRLKKTDRAAYRRGRKELMEGTDMRRHNRVKRYNHDIKRLTEKWMNAKTPEGADAAAEAMARARDMMLHDVDSIEQLRVSIETQ